MNPAMNPPMNPAMITIRCMINGDKKSLTTPSMARLLDVLREDAKLTGTKEGCGEGECGACSVFMDGEIVNSCLVPALQADGAVITTIEGVEKTLPNGRAIQDAFIECGGAQCGICTPGMIVATANLIQRCAERNGDSTQLTEAELREGLAGNLCRCTGYTKIFDAVRQAAGVAPAARRAVTP